MSKHVLYGIEISYFSGKARSYLRWKGVDFEERNADSEFYETIGVPRIGRRVIPVVITPDDHTIQDTTEIMDYYEAQPELGRSFTPSGPVQNMVARLMELFADEWLLIPGMHYRWEYDSKATMTEFGLNILPHGTREEQEHVGKEVGGVFGGFGPILGINDLTKSAVEQSWKNLLGELDTHFRAHPYLLGARPSIGDFALVGALYAHMYRDSTAGALMRQEGVAVAQYVERMMWPSGQPLGEYLPNDEIPDTLLPILSRMMTEQMPVMADTVQKLGDWKAENPDTEIPRMIGMHSFTIEGATSQRGVFPYTVWLLGRALDAYQALTGNACTQADELFEKCGGGVFSDITISTPVKLHKFELIWADAQPH